MSNCSLGRGEVEEQHHVSSNPMQTSPGPSAQKKKANGSHKSVHQKHPIIRLGRKGGKQH